MVRGLFKEIIKYFSLGLDLYVLKILIYDVGIKCNVIFYNHLVTWIVVLIASGMSFTNLIEGYKHILKK
ncbi:hypothetical protein [Clostridium tetani]|uniref:Uncharacterized protein n=1 Tax=Clostridium tetani TaxID=1513 RepID=A0ABY0ET75_CLOTA|nr:hypothetical protein [Clostridium tetani]RXI58971.1 hypothetical protein DP131_00425 [Clostridium tetani]